jgi:hypothetical protein
MSKLYQKGRRVVLAVRDLNLLGGLDRPTDGTIELDGTDLGTLRETQLTRLRAESIGVRVPDLQPGVPTLSAAETKGRLHQARITVTLWCEWPSGPHPLEGDDGSYTIAKMPDALIRYLPYLRHLITALGLAAPALGSDQVKDQVETAARTLEFINKHASTAALVPGRDALSPSEGTTRAETGADFRALDPDNEKNWGRLSPVTRPEDLRTIYLCPRHTHDFDYPYTATRLNP